ncbi:MAG TPA: hypothetical protein VGI23_11105 [Steroidobacteraceae bacterium]|jgi:hypothetical protein
MARKSTLASIKWLRASRQRDAGLVLRDKELSPGVAVYHYLEYPHALAIFSENRLRLANPAGWTDPYELGRLARIPAGNSVYALCFNRSRYDEPAWRMVGFGRTNALVRIRCRMRNLLAAAVTLAEQREGQFYIGKVRYDQREPAVKDDLKSAAGLLLHKSPALRFEREVRALWFDSEPQNKGLFLPIQAQETITQVMCSPHAHPDVKARIQQEFEKFGVSVVDAAV